MKQANNSEMDLLLRSLARRQTRASLLADSLLEDDKESPHLDADELSAYAERTLPAATRARYTTHLADCARCRKIVADLAPVVAASVPEHAVEREAATFAQSIRQFFSWQVLRYAVPALSLLAFVVVGLVVYRDWSGRLVARRPDSPAIKPDQPAQTSPSAAEPQKSETFYDSNSNLRAEHQPKVNQPARTDADKSDVTTPVEAPVVNLSKDAGAAKPAPTVAPPTYAPEPAGEPAPKPQEQVAEVRRREAAAQPQTASPAAKRQDQRATDNFATYGERAKEEERDRAKAEDKQTQAATTASTNAPAAKARTMGAGRAAGAGNKADEAAETRSVAGRQFRREGGMWVDRAYHSGISLTHVARGSEQYRALIADEPAIRTITEQLQGEVILIWNGRGYRIR